MYQTSCMSLNSKEQHRLFLAAGDKKRGRREGTRKEEAP